MMRRRHISFARSCILSLAATIAVACGDNGTEPTPVPPAGPSALRITPQAPSLRLGESISLGIEFVDASGTPVDASGAVTWSSNTPDVVSVDAAGEIAARAIGAATVEARSGNLSGTTTVTVLALTAVTGSNTPVSATIDSAGGTLTATATDGTRYTLHVPPGALREATSITLTPLASIDNFPAAAGPSAAVLFEPDGLTFTVPAELTIVAPSPFSPASVAFSQSGDAFGLAPARLNGDTAYLQIGHFSSGGTTSPTQEEVEALMPGTGDPEASAKHGVVAELNRAGAAGEYPDVGVVAQQLEAWFHDGVMPGLEAAEAGARDIENALGEWLRWYGAVATWADGYLQSEIELARAAAAAAMRASIDRLNQQCIDRNDPALAGRVVQLAGLSVLLGLDALDPSLDFEAVMADLCMRITIEATLPDPFVDGGTLEVRAGIAIGGHPADYSTPLDIMLSSSTASLTQTYGRTDPTGRFTTEVTLEPGNDEAVIEIRATHPAAAQMTATHTIRSSADYELILHVNGTETDQLDPGGVAWLQVTLSKAGAPLPGATVPLTVRGGGSVEPSSVTTDDAGIAAAVYTAPDSAGSVEIIALFSEGSSQVADTVTIDVTGAGSGNVAVNWVYQRYELVMYAIEDEEQLTTVRDELRTAGTLTFTDSLALVDGQASAVASLTHESEVISNDTPTPLVVTADATIDATVEIPGEHTAAYVDALSWVRVQFEVRDQPAYFEIIARGAGSESTRASIALVRRLDEISFEDVATKAWSEGEEWFLPA